MKKIYIKIIAYAIFFILIIYTVIISGIHQFTNPEMTQTQLTIYALKHYWKELLGILISYAIAVHIKVE